MCARIQLCSTCSLIRLRKHEQCLFLGEFSQNTITPLQLFPCLPAFSLFSCSFCSCTRVLGERDFTSTCMYVCVCIWAFAARVTTCSPQQVHRGFPLGHYAKGREEAAKRQGEERQGGTEWRCEVESRLSFLVLARPRNLSVSLAITLIWWQEDDIVRGSFTLITFCYLLIQREHCKQIYLYNVLWYN